MRKAAGQLSYSLHFQRLPQRLLNSAPFLRFAFETIVGLRQFERPLRNGFLQDITQALRIGARLLRHPDAVNRGRQKICVTSQEQRVGYGEDARHATVDLKHAERGTIIPAYNDDGFQILQGGIPAIGSALKPGGLLGALGGAPGGRNLLENKLLKLRRAIPTAHDRA